MKERNSFIYKFWSYDITKVFVPTMYCRDPFTESNDSYEFEIELLHFGSHLDNNYLAKSIYLKIDDILSLVSGTGNLLNNSVFINPCNNQ